MPVPQRAVFGPPLLYPPRQALRTSVVAATVGLAILLTVAKVIEWTGLLF